MNLKEKKAVKTEMKRLAKFDERFRIIYDFFDELGTVDKKGFVIVCRAKMPFVADKITEVVPGLNNSTVIQHMKGVHYLSDGQVIEVSAILLDIIIKTVHNTLETPA
jgi:hypothetical protein